MIYLVYTLTLILLFSVQTTFLGIFFLGGVAPDLILITAVYCGISFRKNSGIWLAVLIGFVQDCLSGGLLGVNSLSKGLAGLFFYTLKDKIIMQGILPISFFMFAASLADGLIYFLAMTSLLEGQVEGSFLFSSIILFGVCNAIVAPFLFYVFDKGRQWTHGKSPTQTIKAI